MGFIDKLMTPTERLLELASENPSQCIVVTIVEDRIRITYQYHSTATLLGMLAALEDELKKVVARKAFNLAQDDRIKG